MGEPNTDYLDKYREIFEAIANSADIGILVGRLPYKLAGYEIVGEIFFWSLKWLQSRRCPRHLMTRIITSCFFSKVGRKFLMNPKFSAFKGDLNDTDSGLLLEFTFRTIHNACKHYCSANELSTLPPPPSSITLCNPLVSSRFFKNLRRTMEDQCMNVPDLHALFNIKGHGPASFYGVFDGHSGPYAAVYSCHHLYQFVAEHHSYPETPEVALINAFNQADVLFRKKSKRLDSGTTAIVALVRPDENKLYIAWVGDSQAFLVAGNTIYQMGQIHRAVNPSEYERVKSMGGCILGWRVDGRLAVTRAIGDRRYKPYVTSEPDVSVFPLDKIKPDFLIMATDGLWDVVNERQAAEAVYNYITENNGEVDGVASALIQLALSKKSTDNITVTVVFLSEPQPGKGARMDEAIVRVGYYESPHQFHLNSSSPSPMLAKCSSPSQEPIIVPSLPAQNDEADLETADNPTFHPEEKKFLKSLPWTYAEAVKRPKNRNRQRRRRSSDQTQTKNIYITAEPEIVLTSDSKDIESSKDVDDEESSKVRCEEVQDNVSDKIKAAEEKVDKNSDGCAFAEITLIETAEAEKTEEPSNDVADVEVDSAEDSEGEWNYIPGKDSRKNDKKAQVEVSVSEKPETVNDIDSDEKKDDLVADKKDDLDDEEDDMSQLNPDAKEFVPVFGAAADLDDVPIAASPVKGAERSLEAVAVPRMKEFFDEISTRPGDLESVGFDSSINAENSVNGIDATADSIKAQFDADSDKENDLDQTDASVQSPSSNPFADDIVQHEMVQDYFSEQSNLGFKPFDPMQTSMVVLDSPTEGITEKPDLLSPIDDSVQAAASNDNLNSSSGFESENSNEIDLVSNDKCDLVAGIPDSKIEEEIIDVPTERPNLVDTADTNPFSSDNIFTSETLAQPLFNLELSSPEQLSDVRQSVDDEQRFSNDFDSVESQEHGFTKEDVEAEIVERGADLIIHSEDLVNKNAEPGVNKAPEFDQHASIEKGTADELEKDNLSEKKFEEDLLGVPHDQNKEDSAEHSFEVINPEEEVALDSHAMNGSVRIDNDLPLDGHEQKIHKDLVQETVEIDVEPPRNFQPDFLAREDFHTEDDIVPANLQMNTDFFGDSHVAEVHIIPQPMSEPSNVVSNEQLLSFEVDAEIKTEVTKENEDSICKSPLDVQFSHFETRSEELALKPDEDFFAKDDSLQAETKESLPATPSAPLSEDLLSDEVVSPKEEPVVLEVKTPAEPEPEVLADPEIDIDFNKQNGEIVETSTPPSTPALGVEMDKKDELIAAAAGVATVAAAAAAAALSIETKPSKPDAIKKPSAAKTEVKSPAKPISKTAAKPAATSVGVKKPTTAAAPKTTSAAKPAPPKPAAVKAPAATRPAAAKPAAPAAAKPTTKVAPAKPAAAKPTTPTTAKAPPSAAAKAAPAKPKAPVPAVPIKKTTSAPTAAKPASSISASAKKIEPAKPALPKTAPIARTSAAPKPASAPAKPLSSTASKPAAARPSTAVKSTTATKPTSSTAAKPAVGAAKPAAKPLVKPTSAAPKPATTAAKAPLKSAPAAKPAGKTTPTAIKKPGSVPAKPASGNKGPIKKSVDVKISADKEAVAVTKSDNPADLVNQEQVVSTTTNGHAYATENGVGHSEDSSPVDVHPLAAVEAQN